MSTGNLANRYQVIRALGQGAMGTVWLALDKRDGREVAVKVIGAAAGPTGSTFANRRGTGLLTAPNAVPIVPTRRGTGLFAPVHAGPVPHRGTGLLGQMPAKAGGGTMHGASPERALLQFKQEFRLMTQLRHPNCCEVYDYGVSADGKPYFSMEVVPGRGLDEKAPLPEAELRDVLGQLLLALGYLHQRGFVHRDVKSANVRVTPEGVVKLMDYGLMDFAGRSGAPIGGTPAYLSPEAIKRQAVDARADLYAVGVLAYELATGGVPFQATSPGSAGTLEVLRAHLTESIASPRLFRRDLSPALDQIIVRLLAKDPLDRFQSADAVLEALGFEAPQGRGGTLLNPPLLAREGELAGFGEALAAVRARKPAGQLVLRGAAGIGKTRVLAEFRFAAQLEDVPFAAGAWSESDGTPYGGFAEILRGLLPEFEDCIPIDLARHAPVLARLLPELGPVVADVSDDPNREKGRLQVAVAELLGQLARRRGLAIGLENWQWADPLSVELAEYLVRNLQEAPWVVVVATRKAGGETGWLARARARALEPLDRAGITRMVAAMLGGASAAELATAEASAFVARVEGLSAGVPAHVERLLEYLVESGDLARREGRWLVAEVDTAHLPSSLGDLFLQRLDALEPIAIDLARWVALIGGEVPLETLRDVATVPDDFLFAGLQALEAQRLLRGSEAGTYAFVDASWALRLDERLDATERGRRHAAVARSLEDAIIGVALADVPYEAVAAIARHHLAAGHPERPLPFALEAARRGADLFANNEAENFLTQALRPTVWGRAPERARIDFLRLLGDVRRRTGRLVEACADYTEAIAFAQTYDEGLWLGRMLTSYAKALQVLEDYPAALEACARSLRVCQDQGDRAGAARCLLTSSRVHFFQGRSDDAAREARQALAIARAEKAPSCIGEALAFLGYIDVAGGPGDGDDRMQVGVARLNEAVEIQLALGDRIGLNNAYNLLGNAQTMLGDYQDAWATFQQNRQICFEMDYRAEEAFALLNLALVALNLGRLPEAFALAREAGGHAQAQGLRFPLGVARILEATATLYLGDVPGALDLSESALEMAREIGNRYLEILVLPYRMEILTFLGRDDEVLEAGDALAPLIVGGANAEPEALSGAYRAVVLARRGDMADARAVADEAVQVARRAKAKGLIVRTQLARAQVAMREGDLPGARTLALESLTLSESIGTQVPTADLRHLLGELALADAIGSSGDGSGGLIEALGHFRALEAIGGQLGSRLHQAYGLYGMAAAQPHGPDAPAFVARAQFLVETLVDGADPFQRDYFLALPGMPRILEGRHPVFDRGSGSGPLNRVIGLGQGHDLL